MTTVTVAHWGLFEVVDSRILYVQAIECEARNYAKYQRVCTEEHLTHDHAHDD